MKGAIESISQLGLAFFGLTFDIAPQARAAVFSQIHEICFWGQGGYDWNTVYNMPIWLRRFTFSQIRDHYDKENKKSNPQDPNTTNLIDPSGKINTSEFRKASEPYRRPARVK